MGRESTPGKSLKLSFFLPIQIQLFSSVIVVYTPSRGHLNSFTMSCLPRACLSTSFRRRILGFHPIICDVVSGNATFSSLVTLFVVLPFSSLSSGGSLSMFFSCSDSSPSWPILSVCCCNYKLQEHWYLTGFDSWGLKSCRCLKRCGSCMKYEQLVLTLPTWLGPLHQAKVCR